MGSPVKWLFCWVVTCALTISGALARDGGFVRLSDSFSDSVGVMLHDDSERFSQDIYDISRVGARYVRTDIRWRWVDLGGGVYDFSRSDAVIESMLARGIVPYIVLGSINKKYGDDGFPRSVDSRRAFTRWAVAMVERYHGHNIVWEIWNEPNHKTYWRPKPDVAEYGALLEDASCGIKARFPGEVVLGGALAGVDLPFAKELTEQGSLRCITAFSVHPYRDGPPESVAESYVKLRRVLADIPLIAGEWGYSTFDRGVTDSLQADYLQRMFLVNYAEGVPLTIWYAWRDASEDVTDREAKFGVLRSTREPKPAYLALSRMKVALADSVSVVAKKTAGTAGARYVVFRRRNGELMFAAWSIDAGREFNVGDILLVDNICPLLERDGGGVLHLSRTPGYCHVSRSEKLSSLLEVFAD